MLTQKNMANVVAVVLLFSGKRKSGKDYVVAELSKLLGEEKCEVLRLSAPLKKQYALEHDLDFEKLLDSSIYKEKFRKSMIEWGELKRKENPEFFCDSVTKDACKPIMVISDGRRRTDMKYFRERFKTIHVRVEASDKIRKLRGWSFVGGIDDAESECDLDNETVDVFVDNNGDSKALETVLKELTQLALSELNNKN